MAATPNMRDRKTMIRVDYLRHQAALCRRAASVPTAGDALVNRDLLLAAQRFERKADARETMLKARRQGERHRPTRSAP